jgi:uncharacterized membrane protein YfcA
MLRTNKLYRLLFIAATGAAAGFLCGMLGAGGGIVIVYALSRLFEGEESLQKLVFANSVAVLIPLAIISSASYVRGGFIDFPSLLPLVPAAIIGGIIGGFLLGKVSGNALRLIFAAVVILSGILMLK